MAVEARFKASSGAVLRQAALAGMGLAVLPTFMIASDLVAGRLVPVVPAFVPLRLGIYAMYPQGKRVPAKTRAFVDHLARTWKGLSPLPRALPGSEPGPDPLNQGVSGGHSPPPTR